MTTTPATRDEREVKRYRIELNGWNQQFITTDIPSGEYVSAADYALAESELAEVREQLRQMTKDRDDCVEARLHYAGKMGEALGERDELRAELERVKKQVVPLEVLSFLTGYEPLEGVYFEDKHPARPGRYWWRDRLKAAIDAARGVEG